MDLIDEIAKRESITKAAVITRALDSLKASYEPGAAGGAANAALNDEIESLKAKLASAEERAADAERRLNQAESRANAAEARAQSAPAASSASEEELSRLRQLASMREASLEEQSSRIAAKDDEISRLRALVAKHEASLEERKSMFASRETELAAKNAAIAERDARIAALSEQLGAANAKAELAKTANEVKAVMVGDQGEPVDEETARALYMFNMLGGVMGAFQQQVADARVVGEQEGRAAVQRELKDMVDKARNDGYRDAMGYLDNRVTNARDAGAREERARIANMSFFERRRYLRMHIA